MIKFYGLGFLASLVITIMVILFSTSVVFAEIESQNIIILKEDLPHNVEPLLSTKQLQECEELHDGYVFLSEQEFNKRHLYHHFVGDCVLLYDDQIWKYTGEDRYEKLALRLLEIRKNLDELRREQIELMPEFTTKLVIESEIPGTFLYIFEVCAKSSTILASNILVASDIQIIPAIDFPHEFPILPDTCKEFQVDIAATNSHSIRAHNINEEVYVSIVEELGDDVQIFPSPKAQMKSGTVLHKVTCNDDLELIEKASDGSAACVSNETAEILFDRDWGIPVIMEMYEDIES